jgi:hypothetical protein
MKVAHRKLLALVEASSVADVSRRAGVQATTVSNLAGGGLPKARTMAKLSTLGVMPADWFVDAEPEPTTAPSATL